MKELKISPYKILSDWLYDGSKTTQFPIELINDKTIGQNFLLYFFQLSPYNLVISKLFNNFGLYSLDKIEVLKFVKQCILLSGFRQKYIERGSKSNLKFEKMLKLKYPYLKNYEISMLVEFIDKSDEKDSTYEMFGIYTPKKKKSTKTDLKKIENSSKDDNKKITQDDFLGNFNL